jgi:integrase
VPLPAPAAHAVDALLADRGLAAATGAFFDATPLFVDSEGRQLDRFDAGRIVRRLARAVSIRKAVSPHSLRHSFVTLALDAGVPLRDVQDSAGHADPKNDPTVRPRPALARPLRGLCAGWAEIRVKVGIRPRGQGKMMPRGTAHSLRHRNRERQRS